MSIKADKFEVMNSWHKHFSYETKRDRDGLMIVFFFEFWCVDGFVAADAFSCLIRRPAQISGLHALGDAVGGAV